MSNALVTVAQFHGSSDAAVAKDAMDHAGIESEVEDVRLEVHHEDAYRAYDVLETECPALPVIEEAYEAPVAAVCGACGSLAIAAVRRVGVFAGIAALGIAIGVAIGRTDAAFFAVGAAGLFLLMSDRWRCTDCGESWN
ncbi:MAG: hypothetical protein M3P06_04130 [Acidobacteriota bacterium]|nr:hypothetical protein [Acidobacteriota bacterium]